MVPKKFGGLTEPPCPMLDPPLLRGLLIPFYLGVNILSGELS